MKEAHACPGPPCASIPDLGSLPGGPQLRELGQKRMRLHEQIAFWFNSREKRVGKVKRRLGSWQPPKKSCQGAGPRCPGPLGLEWMSTPLKGDVPQGPSCCGKN